MKSMNKRGIEMATSTIIMVLIGLIVLAIIVVIFRQQATKGSESYNQYTQQTTPGALKACDSFILGRSCVADSECTSAKGRRPASGFFDPPCPADKPVCCESA